MNVWTPPARELKSLRASVRVPGSKSITNRALLTAALADGPTTLQHALFSDDSRHFLGALSALGFKATADAATSEIRVDGQGGRIPATHAELFIGNAGTAARFLTAMLTLGHGTYVLDGEPRMRERPIGDLVLALRELGAVVSPLAADRSTDPRAWCPPLRIDAHGLPGVATRVAGDISSQYLSGLLLAAPYAQGPVSIEVVGTLNSQPYVDLTLALMADFGVRVERDGYRRFVVSPARYRAQPTYVIESDASAASYFFALPVVAGGSVRVVDLSRSSRQGDVGFIDVLAQMGCRVIDGADWIEVVAPSGVALRGVDVDLRHIPDTAQTLAAVAPFASTPTTIRGIASARVKETDRVAAMAAELERLGVRVEERDDGLTIWPAEALQPALVQTYNDHRMAMAFALTTLRVPGAQIADPGCTSKTFPGYFETLAGALNQTAA